MPTANDLQRRGESLLDRPQRFGILPTWWFWRDRENWRPVRWGFGALVAVMCIILAIVRPHPLVGVTSMVVVITLAEGLLEKYVRRRVMKRRQLAAASRSAAELASGQHTAS